MRLWTLLLLLPFGLNAQDYNNSIEKHRNHYVAEHLEEARSPIKYAQVQHLRFFEIDESYLVQAKLELINDSDGFMMQTHSGDERKYFTYAKLHFDLKGMHHELKLYQSKRLLEMDEYKNYLFLPFTDDTNYKSTFGGGRYLDFKLEDIQDGTLTIDFNKAYNPYCAYAGGFSCAIPPKENDMKVAIKAGEAKFAVEPKH